MSAIACTGDSANCPLSCVLPSQSPWGPCCSFPELSPSSLSQGKRRRQGNGRVPAEQALQKLPPKSRWVLTGFIPCTEPPWHLSPCPALCPCDFYWLTWRRVGKWNRESWCLRSHHGNTQNWRNVRNPSPSWHFPPCPARTGLGRGSLRADRLHLPL